MNTFNISITAKNTLIALQRVVGILSRGRITTSAMSFKVHENGDTCAINFTCYGDDALLHRLQAQCRKVIEVQDVGITHG